MLGKQNQNKYILLLTQKSSDIAVVALFPENII